MANAERGRSPAAASVILGILWVGFAILAAMQGPLVHPEAGAAYINDTVGIGAACLAMTPVVITLGIGLAGVAFAVARRVTALIVVAIVLHLTLTIWIGILFWGAARIRAG
jgi:hypothetical protein